MEEFALKCSTFLFHMDVTQVREKDLSVVISTLEEEFNIYKEVGGESVPVHSQDVFNGLQKNGREGRLHSPGGDPCHYISFQPMLRFYVYIYLYLKVPIYLYI